MKCPNTADFTAHSLDCCQIRSGSEPYLACYLGNVRPNLGVAQYADENPVIRLIAFRSLADQHTTLNYETAKPDFTQ